MINIEQLHCSLVKDIVKQQDDSNFDIGKYASNADVSPEFASDDNPLYDMDFKVSDTAFRLILSNLAIYFLF